MHKKRFHLFREFSKKTKRVFRARNIIIVSDQTLDHVPLTGTMQVLILVGVLGFFSGVSYLTGSYMNARVVIREKEKTIARTKLEKSRVNEEIALLKRDIGGIRKPIKDIADGSKEITKRYSSSMDYSAFSTDQQNGVNPMFNQNSDKLNLRIAYLEERMKRMNDENDQLVHAIRKRTNKKIEIYEDIIAMTGLDTEALERDASAKAAGEAKQNASTTPIPSAQPPAASSKTDNTTVARAKGDQGGPFISENSFSHPEAEELLSNVDRLVLLHTIVHQLPLAQPINNAQITSGFGRRVDPFNSRVAIHPGIDFSGPVNSPVAVTNSGKVVYAGRKAAYGNVVDVEHEFGIVTRYAHLSKIIAKEGENVKKGQIIGLEGSTGRSTGPHLHYEVRINDHPVNPMKFLQAGEYVSEK